MLVQHFHSIALLPALGIPEEIDYLFPAFSLFVHALRSSLVYPCILGIVSYVLQDAIQKPYLRALAFLLILLSILPPDASTRWEWIFSLANQSFLLLIAAILIRFFARRNVLAYLLTFLLLSLCRNAYQLLSQPSSFMQWNGAALLFLAGLVMIKTATE